MILRWMIVVISSASYAERGTVRSVFFFKDTATTEIYTSVNTLSLHDALPISVSADLYRAVAQEAYRDGLPLAVHLAESREEVELVRDGAGPFAELLRARGIAVAAQGCTPVALLARLGVLRLGTLCIHAVHLDARDIALLRDARAAVAHCPRSNR